MSLVPSDAHHRDQRPSLCFKRMALRWPEGQFTPPKLTGASFTKQLLDRRVSEQKKNE